MKRVLLIDDSVTIHRVIDICLDKEKFTTEKTFSADDAIAKLKANPVDIVLLDNKLEGINLADFNQKIRSLAPSVWIILLTGAFDSFSAANLQASGADDFIFKPFDSNAIEQKIIYGIEHGGANYVPAVPASVVDESDTEIIIPEEEEETESEIIDLRAEEPAEEEIITEEKITAEDEITETAAEEPFISNLADETDDEPAFTDEEEQVAAATITAEEKEEIKSIFSPQEEDGEPIDGLNGEELDSLMKELHVGEAVNEAAEEIPADIYELKSIETDAEGEPDITELLPFITDEASIAEDEADTEPVEGEVGYNEDDTEKAAVEETPIEGEFEDLTQISAEELSEEDEIQLPDAEIKIIRDDVEEEAAEEIPTIDDIDFSSLTAVSAEELIEDERTAEPEPVEEAAEAAEDTEPVQEAEGVDFSSLTEISPEELSDEPAEEQAEEPQTEAAEEPEIGEEQPAEEAEADEVDFADLAEISLDEFEQETAEPELEEEPEPVVITEEITEQEEPAEPEEAVEATEVIAEEPVLPAEIAEEVEEAVTEAPVQFIEEQEEQQIQAEIAPEPEPLPEPAPVIAPLSRDEIKAAVEAAIDADLLKDIIKEVLAEKIEAAVRDTLPAIAERIITEEIERLKRGE